MRTYREWNVGDGVYYKTDKHLHYQSGVITGKYKDMHNIDTFHIRKDDGTLVFVPCACVVDEDTKEHIDDMKRDEDLRVAAYICNNKDAYDSTNEVTLGVEYLSSIFGKNYAWRVSWNDIIGCDQTSNHFVRIVDGAAPQNAEQNKGWLAITYICDGSITASMIYKNDAPHNYDFLKVVDEYRINGINNELFRITY